MKRYYSPEGWEQRRRYYEEGPSSEWRELYRDVRDLIREDPGSEKAQAVSDRWLALSVRAYHGDAEVQRRDNATFRDPETAQLLRARVVQVLGLMRQ